jgi:hypothetical protein
LEAYKMKTEKGNKYILSFYMKAEKPGAKCNVLLWSRNSEMKDTSYGIYTTYTDTWERYSFLVPEQGITRKDWRLRVVPIDKCAFWIDAIQLEKNQMTPFKYQECFTLDIQKPGNIFFTDEDKKIDVHFYNPNKSISKDNFSYKIYDYEDILISEENINFTINPDSKYSIPISLPEEIQNGFYKIYASLDKNTDGIYRNEAYFCIVPHPVFGSSPEANFFGTCDYLDVTSPELLSALRRIGSSRYMVPLRLGWNLLEPQKGKFIWENMDRHVSFLKSYGFNLYGYIYSDPGRVPEWSDKRKRFPGSTVDFKDFVYNLVSRYKNDINIWDTLAEMDLALPKYFGEKSPELYAELVKAGNEGAKKADPNSVFYVCSVSNCDTDRGYPFTKKVLNFLSGSFDGMAPHPYTHPRTIGPGLKSVGPSRMTFLNKLKEGIKLASGKHFAISEFGYNHRGSPGSKDMKIHGEYMAKSFIYARSLKEVEFFLWFNSYHQWWTDYIEDYGIWMDAFIPTPAAAVFATSAYFLNSVHERGVVNFGDLAECFLFKTSRNVIAALWGSDEINDQDDVKIAIPCGNLKIFNIVGKDVTDIYKKDKTFDIPLSKSPLYIVSADASLASLKNILEAAPLKISSPIKIYNFCPDSSTIMTCIKNFSQNPINGGLEIKIQTKSGIESLKASVMIPPGKMEIVKTNVKTLFKSGLEYDVHTDFKSDAYNLTVGNKFAFERCDKIADKKIEIDGDVKDWESVTNSYSLGFDNLVPPDAIAHRLWTGNDDLSARWKFAHDSKYLYLLLEVKDDKHFNNNTGKNLWNGDSVQIAIDPKGDALEFANLSGYDSDDIEFGVALTGKGIEFYQWYPSVSSQDADKKLQYFVKRLADSTVYEIGIPFGLLGADFKAGKIFGVNFVIFDDDDGEVAKYHMELTGGITEGKKPFLFKKFILE